MSFNFPDAPVVGDEYTTVDASYIYDGDVWSIKQGGDITDYVMKSGDTVTGLLTFTDPVGVRVVGDQSGTPLGTIELMAGAAAQKGGVGLFAPDGIRHALIGWGSASEVELRCEANTKWKVSGGLLMADAKGIHWGSNSAVTDKLDFSKGICLYGYAGPSQFGFTITSGTLNYIVQNEGNKHEFWVGSKKALVIEDMEIRPINKIIGTTITDGLNGYFIGDSWHGMCFNGAQALQFIEYHATWQFVERKSGTTGGTVVYLIDKVGASGNNYFATAPEARVIARELNIESEDRGLDIVKTLGLALARIKKLEEEVASLRGRR